MKLSSAAVSSLGHPGDVLQTTNFRLGLLAGDQGLHLCCPPCKPESGQYTVSLTRESGRASRTPGRVFERVTRGFKKVETGWRPAA